jgi:DNA-binding SARP family transcriptional activator/nucleoid-associated protein YgaU
MKGRTWAFLRGVGSLVLLAALLVGPPVGLAYFVGWPLPAGVPSLADISEGVRVGIGDVVVVKALAIVAWVLWGQVAFAILDEAAATLRGRAARHRSVVPGLQAAIGRLVASATLVATAFTPLQAAGAASVAPEPVAQLVPTPSLAEAVTSAMIAGAVPSPAAPRPVPRPVVAPADDSATLHVQRHDSWWAIAERTLGDGLRWREVRDLNVGRTMPDGHTIAAGSDLLRPGWVLVLPGGAVAEGEDASPSPSEPTALSAAAQRPAGDGDVPTTEAGGAEVAVVAGDSMWGIAERHLVASLDRPASTPEVAIYWATFVEANRDRFADPTNPDLIHVGQCFVLPPVPGVLAPSSPAAVGASGGAAPASTTPTSQDAPPPTPAPPPEVATTVPQAPDTTAAPDRTQASPAPTSTVDPRSPSTARPPARSTEPVQTGEAAGDEVEDNERSSSPAPLVVGLTSSLVAVGAVRAIRRRRRRRDHLAPGTAASSAGDTTLHRQLVADADEDQIDTLAGALSTLAAGVAGAGHACRPLVVQHGSDHLDVLLDEPTLPAVAGWRAQANGEVWTAEPSGPASEGTGDAAGAATPLLVTVGQPEDGSQLYLDLEAARLITLAGDEGLAHNVAATMATELAHSPLSANAQVVVVGDGLGAERLADFDRVRVTDTWAGVAADFAAWNDQSHDALAAHDWPNPFAARGHDADHDALIPLVVIATELPDDLDLLGLVAAGPAATAAVIVGDALPGATVIDCAPDQLSLPQLGLTCRPLALEADEVDAVADLLRCAEDTSGEQLAFGLDQDPGGGAVNESNGTDEPYDDPPHEILVRLLGDITVEGGTAPLTGKQTALVAYIALHRNISSDRVVDAVWVTPAAVSPRKRLANTITKCRAAIGARHLPVAKDSRYTVGPDVGTDLDLFERRVAAAASMPPERAVDTLRSALDLVRGPVFDYPSTERDSYSWVDVENWISTWELKVTTTAERLADLYLDLDDAAAAVQVAERTLRAVPTHPGLTEALMRGHAANGDRLAVQRVYQAHVNALGQLDLDTVADSTAELYERLRAG